MNRKKKKGEREKQKTKENVIRLVHVIEESRRRKKAEIKNLIKTAHTHYKLAAKKEKSQKIFFLLNKNNPIKFHYFINQIPLTF